MFNELQLIEDIYFLTSHSTNLTVGTVVKIIVSTFSVTFIFIFQSPLCLSGGSGDC